MADVYKIAEQFGGASIAVEDIYAFAVRPGSVMQDYQTEKNGFIITTEGSATLLFNKSPYQLSPGIIVHGTENMTIDATVTSRTSWEYYLILYRLEGGTADAGSEIRNHFELKTGVNPRIQELLQIMKRTTVGSDKIKYFRTKALFFDMLYEAFASCQYCVYTKSQELSITDAALFIRTHFAERLTLAGLAATCGMTPGNFSYLFHKYKGTRPMDYVTQCRIYHAQQLLLSTNLPIHEVAAQVGYSDPLYFSRIFKKHTGFPPSKVHLGTPLPFHIHP